MLYLEVVKSFSLYNDDTKNVKVQKKLTAYKQRAYYV